MAVNGQMLRGYANMLGFIDHSYTYYDVQLYLISSFQVSSELS